MVQSVSPDYRSRPGEYGETKKPKQFLLTPSASDMLDALAAEYNSTRSDMLERIIRGLSSLDAEARARLMLQFGAIEDESK